MATLCRTHRVPHLPLPADAYGFCLPCGIGDASWIYSKLRHLPALTGRPVYLSMPDAEPRRGHQLLELLPDVRWAGYETGWLNADVFANTLPPDATLADLRPGVWHALEVNTWLERGRKLSHWLPWLPTDYHYEIPVSAVDHQAATELLRDLPKPWIACYTSNRDKDTIKGWNFWHASGWCSFLRQVAPQGTCIFLGAPYDEDKAMLTAATLASAGQRIKLCVGQPLGVALEVIRRSAFCVSYASGIGILAGVLRTPTLMHLPRPLTSMADSYADPADLIAGRYANLIAPTVAQAVTWFEQHGKPHLR